jgi:hypothetical protein
MLGPTKTIMIILFLSAFMDYLLFNYNIQLDKQTYEMNPILCYVKINRL